MRSYNKGSVEIKINSDELLRVDGDIAFMIYYLNSKGIKTLGCCSGHDRYFPTIVFEERGEIKELFSGKLIPRTKRFYVKDKKGFYFIPEVSREK